MEKLKKVLMEELGYNESEIEQALKDLDYYEYSDLIDFYQNIIYKLGLSFRIAELTICKDEYHTITYFEKGEFIVKLNELADTCLQDTRTLEDLYKSLNEYEILTAKYTRLLSS